MTTAEVAANSGGSHADARLEDVMVAMDVVDTVRHRQILVDRELNADARRANLKQRLREIYTAQGIDVTDDALDAGIAALEEERFSYSPAPSSFAVRLAKLYVSRHRWGKRARIFGTFATIVLGLWFFTAYLPTQRLEAQLPQAIERTYSSIVNSTEDAAALDQALEINSHAQLALAAEDFSAAETDHASLQTLLQRIQEIYSVRIVSQPNELSGVWRVPDVNDTARNYYLIVEAVAPTGRVLTLPVTSEEDGQTRLVQKWGVRVSADTFDQVSADKLDDGIIQENVIGTKPAGRITPDYHVPIAGGTITDW